MNLKRHSDLPTMSSKNETYMFIQQLQSHAPVLFI